MFLGDPLEVFCCSRWHFSVHFSSVNRERDCHDDIGIWSLLDDGY